MKITLISCGSTKATRPEYAGLMYRSSLFLGASSHAKASGAWGILSAAHGLLMPCDIIVPYDVSMRDLRAGRRLHARPARGRAS